MISFPAKSEGWPKRALLTSISVGLLVLLSPNISESNTAPTIQPIGDKTAIEGELLSFAITATDPDSPPQTLTFTPEFGFPEDASLTPDGVFSWTPNEFWGGAVFGVIVRVTDNGDPPLSDTQLFFISVEEVSEIALIEQLIADVEALAASGELKSNQVNGLLGKLREAIKKLETGQPTAACNKLGEFIVQVESLISAKKLNATDGQQLITSAEGIAALLDCESSSAAGTARSSPEAIPAAFALSQNRPNPFQQQTEMILRLPASTEYALTIHDVAGRLIRRYSGSAGPGEVVLRWEGTNEAGDRVQPGVYFYRLCAGTHEETKSMLLLPR